MQQNEGQSSLYDELKQFIAQQIDKHCMLLQVDCQVVFRLHHQLIQLWKIPIQGLKTLEVEKFQIV